MFAAIVVDRNNQSYNATLRQVDESFLPDGNVLIDVKYSSLNYKDALAITGKSPVVRHFPIIPGIDLAGVVIHSTDPKFTTNTPVILNGWGVGENHSGGYAQKARVKSEWLTPLPHSFNLKQAMSIGTAGYTAMLAVLALERNGINPNKGKILVTGATGGVGSFAVTILSKLGYHVIASTGKPESESNFLQDLGANKIINTLELITKKPLEKEQWAGIIDVVGNETLAYACASTQYGGIVVACGLAGGMNFPTTVAPFILRGISLIGIDSVYCPNHIREEAWHRLMTDLDLSHLEKITTTIKLSEVINASNELLKRNTKGRIVVDLN